MSLYSSSYLALRPIQLLAIVHSSQLHLISGMHRNINTLDTFKTAVKTHFLTLALKLI